MKKPLEKVNGVKELHETNFCKRYQHLLKVGNINFFGLLHFYPFFKRHQQVFKISTSVIFLGPMLF